MPDPTPFMHDANRRYIKGSSNESILTYVSYGSFVFPAAVSVSFNIAPVYDSSNRFAKWYTHTFTIETVIDPTTPPMNDSGGQYPVDLNMSQVRRWLSIPGQRLVFWNLGIGQNQVINTSPFQYRPVGTTEYVDPISGSDSPIKQDPIPDEPSSSHYSFVVSAANDLNFGPKPQLLACECIGGSRAFRIVWTVECALPICCLTYTQSDGFTLCNSPEHFNGVYQEFFDNVLTDNIKVLEFNYSLSWEVDEARFTRFTIVGSVEFSGQLLFDASPSVTASSGAVIDTGRVIDALAKSFLLRAGFNRSIQWDLSRDKRRLDFRITDKEIPSDQPYYPGIKDCSVQHSVEGNPLTYEWNMSFRASYELQPGVAKFWALIAFVALVQDRTKKIELGATRAKDKKGSDKPVKPFILPTSFSFDEDIYSRKVSFSFTFSLLCELSKLFELTRMFSNVNTPPSWAVHRQFLSPETLDLKGGAQIRTLKHEPLITACTYPEPFLDVTQPWSNNRSYPQSFALFETKCPPKEKSLIYFSFVPEVSYETDTVSMQPVSYLSPKAATQNYGQEDQATIPKDLSVDPNKKELTFLDSLLPDGAATLKFIKDEMNKNSNTYVDTSLKELGVGGDLTFNSFTPMVQRTSLSSQKLTITGGMASVCWEQSAPALKQVRVITTNQESKLVTPVLKKSNFQGPFVQNQTSQTPIYLYRFQFEYEVIGGMIQKGMLININGQDVEWDSTVRAGQIADAVKGLNGFKIGDFTNWLNNPPPIIPYDA